MAFPRLCASAEVVWSNRTDPVAEYEDFRAHLAVQLARLDALGVAFPPAMADRAAARGAGHAKPPTDTPRLAAHRPAQPHPAPTMTVPEPHRAVFDWTAEPCAMRGWRSRCDRAPTPTRWANALSTR